MGQILDRILQGIQNCKNWHDLSRCSWLEWFEDPVVQSISRSVILGISHPSNPVSCKSSPVNVIDSAKHVNIKLVAKYGFLWGNATHIHAGIPRSTRSGHWFATYWHWFHTPEYRSGEECNTSFTLFSGLFTLHMQPQHFLTLHYKVVSWSAVRGL